jgi:hypothetical protein
MIYRGETVKTAGCADYLLYPWIAKLNYLPRLYVDKMIMLAALVSTLKLRNILPELMFDHEVAIEEQFNCIIQRCPAYPIVLVFHENIE